MTPGIISSHILDDELLSELVPATRELTGRASLIHPKTDEIIQAFFIERMFSFVVSFQKETT